MANMNEGLKVLVENATTFKERNRIFALTEAEATKVGNDIVNKLYTSMMSKAHVDFDDIPNSKGDITKYSGFKTMMDTLGHIKTMAENSMTKIRELEIVEKAISNIIAYRDTFTRGFGLRKEYIILQYNTLVLSCVEGISSLIVSYIDFIKRVDKAEFTIINTKQQTGSICIKNLDSFNKSVASGEFTKITNTVLKTDSEGLVGAAIVISAAIIGAVIAAYFGIRELIFYFYYSRMKVSDYLQLQSTFLEMNRNNVESNSAISPSKKKEIIKKQEQLVAKMRKYADKLKVESTMARKKAEDDVKKDNSSWRIDDIQSSTGSSDSNGYQLL